MHLTAKFSKRDSQFYSNIPSPDNCQVAGDAGQIDSIIRAPDLVMFKRKARNLPGKRASGDDCLLEANLILSRRKGNDCSSWAGKSPFPLHDSHVLMSAKEYNSSALIRT